jgi:hypothetical protein
MSRKADRAANAMNDNIRVSDGDREHVAEQLREHYADGRLSSDELDERITRTLGAKTFGDLRAVMTDLPGGQQLFPQPAGQARPQPRPHGRPAVHYHRGPRVFPLLAFALIATLIFSGAGGVLIALVKVALVLFLAACVAAVFAVSRLRRRFRQLARQAEFSGRWHQASWHHES